MNRYKIEGGYPLRGKTEVCGAKNAALPILAATIINGRKSIIHNCPDLSDITSIIEILKYLGCKVERRGKDVTVDSSTFISRTIPHFAMKQTRSSTIFAGALLARNGYAFIPGSGGCHIGARPIDLHLKGFKALGADITFQPDGIVCRAKHLRACRIELDFPSVGATENLMIASSLTPGTTIITNAAMEPEIVNLAQYLRSVGAHIKGDGTSEIHIKGTLSPKDAEVTVIPDRIVASTYASAVASAGGSVEICGISPGLLSPFLAVMRRMGMSINCTKNGFTICKNSGLVNLPYVCTGPYPLFPTDCQPMLVAAMTTAYGFGAVREKIFENRFGHCARLNDMGANVTVRGRTALIRGVPKLKGANVDACDLRCGAALTVAALGAGGTTYISNTHYIDRGYENLVRELSKIGAKAERID